MSYIEIQVARAEMEEHDLALDQSLNLYLVVYFDHVQDPA